MSDRELRELIIQDHLKELHSAANQDWEVFKSTDDIVKATLASNAKICISLAGMNFALLELEHSDIDTLIEEHVETAKIALGTLTIANQLLETRDLNSLHTKIEKMLKRIEKANEDDEG